MPHVQVPEGGVDSISTGALEPSLRLCAASRQPELDGLREEAAQVCGNAVCGNIELKRTNDHHQVHRRENSERSLKVKRNQSGRQLSFRRLGERVDIDLPASEASRGVSANAGACPPAHSPARSAKRTIDSEPPSSSE
jgi:hypothetical protein